VYYPQLLFALAPGWVIAAGAGVVGLVLRPAGPGPRAYLALLAGEAAAFIGIASFFNSVAAGSDRYLLSVLLLLLPAVGAAITAGVAAGAARRDGWGHAVRLGCGAAGVALLLYGGGMVAARENRFPARDTVQVAALVQRQFADGTLPPDTRIPVYLPAEEGRADARYVLQVLTNHPDNFDFLFDRATFAGVASTAHPRLWIADTTAGDPGAPSGQRLNMGQYRLAWGGPQALLRATVQPAAGASAQVVVVGQGYPPHTRVGVWATSPLQKVIPLGEVWSDAQGAIRLTFQPPAAQHTEPGHWAVTAQEARVDGLVGLAWFRLAWGRDP
jgi:hypothetical protein